MDKARKQTDKILRKLETEIEEVYNDADKEAQKKLNAYLSKHKAKDKAMQEQVEDGEITEDEYEDWRYKNITSGKEWKKAREEVAREYVKTDKKALGLINVAVPTIFALNFNYMAGKIGKEAKSKGYRSSIPNISTVQYLKTRPEIIPKKLDVPKDMRWNMRKVNSAVIKGIKKGESMDKIAKRLEKVTDMDKNAAIRNARTMVTAAENGARQATAEAMANIGIPTKKQWNAVGDERTRESHLMIDGEVVKYDQPFSNGLMFAGDPNGDLGEVYNCRCSTDYRFDDGNYGRFPGSKTVSERMRRSNKSAERVAKSTKNGIITVKEGIKPQKLLAEVSKEEFAEAIHDNPKLFSLYTPVTFKRELENRGFNVTPLSDGRKKGIKFEAGGGYKINFGGDRIIQYHPAKDSRHGGRYYKISSGERGVRWFDTKGNEKGSRAGRISKKTSK